MTMCGLEFFERCAEDAKLEANRTGIMRQALYARKYVYCKTMCMHNIRKGQYFKNLSERVTLFRFRTPTGGCAILGRMFSDVNQFTQ